MLLVCGLEASWRAALLQRPAWDTQVAYASQFETPVDSAHRGKAKIKAKLIGRCDPDEWDFPPKPKWMRWRTYNRLYLFSDALFTPFEQDLLATSPSLNETHFQQRIDSLQYIEEGAKSPQKRCAALFCFDAATGSR